MIRLTGAVATVLTLGLGAGVMARGAGQQTAQPTGASTVAPARPVAVPAAAATPFRTSSQRMAASHAGMPAETQTALVKQYCAGCHNDRAKAGNLSLAGFDAATLTEHREQSEKMIRKLRTGMMPPAGAKRPKAETLNALVAAMETEMDAAATAHPIPGRRTFQRLNRAEYARAVRDLLAIEVDVTAFLPADTISHGFDNIADVQAFSPTLLEGYLRAAAKISSLAVGDPKATAAESTYKIPRTASQLDQVEGAPIGTRGGISVVHNFPADGEYTFRMMLHSIPTGQLYGSTATGEQIEVSINGDRVALLDINPRMSEADPNGMNLQTPRIHVKAGAQRVSAVFLQRHSGPVDDLIAPIEHTLADTQIGAALGVTTVPHMRDLAIGGPFTVTGVSDTPSRRKLFSCRPTTAADETPCARTIVQGLLGRAYRRPVADADVQSVMAFYESTRAEGADFEAGIRAAVQAVLASPHFLFRVEAAPARPVPGQPYRVADLDLASRLSFFLWATVPDQELIDLASQGQLAKPAVLERQVARMLADSRAEALATRFASQWLRLQDLEKLHPDALLYPQYDQTLATAMQRETELLFGHVIAHDRSVLELLTADYTFVNERLAKHYGIPNVTGSRFRQVSVSDPNRHGLLGHGSVLAQTSVADRTSPVMRGKWVMEVLLGSPPPPPPPNVPALEDTKAAAGAKLLTVRERMEEHRKNPACTSCHRVIDPLGLALENFDVTGAWRIKDSGAVVDASGTLYDGTRMDGPIALRSALLKHESALLLSFAENLMTYGLGRRMEADDMPAIRAVVRDAAGNGNRISSFILGVVRSPAFQMNQAEETTEAR